LLQQHANTAQQQLLARQSNAASQQHLLAVHAAASQQHLLLQQAAAQAQQHLLLVHAAAQANAAHNQQQSTYDLLQQQAAKRGPFPPNVTETGAVDRTAPVTTIVPGSALH
jgi:hypothetical protein